MTLDPRYGFWISIIAAIIGALIAGGATFTGIFGEATADKILAVLGLTNTVINAVNAVLHAIPSQPNANNQFFLGPKK